METETIKDSLGEGGDIIFTAGKGYEGALNGSIIFKLPDGTEKLKLDPNGEFFVNGEKVADDRLLYEAFKQWVCDAVYWRS